RCPARRPPWTSSRPCGTTCTWTPARSRATRWWAPRPTADSSSSGTTSTSSRWARADRARPSRPSSTRAPTWSSSATPRTSTGHWNGVGVTCAAANCQVLTTPIGVTATANPVSPAQGCTTLILATVTLGTNPTSTGVVVTADVSQLGGSVSQVLLDDGVNDDG